MADEKPDSFAPEHLKGAGHIVDGEVVAPLPDPTVTRGLDGRSTSGGRTVLREPEQEPTAAPKKAAPVKK